jgi:hypothetical protein
MKTYVQPEIEEVLFASENITDIGNESGSEAQDPL